MRNNRKKAFTLVELLVYMAVLALIVIIVTGAIVQMSRIFLKVRVERRVTLAAETALERIVKELRLSNGLNLSQTLPGSSIALNSFTAFGESGVSDPEPHTIFLGSVTDAGKILITIGGVTTPLTPPTVTVSNLTFRLLAPGGIADSRIVRVEMTVTSGSGTNQVTRNYYATALLRQSY